MAKQQFVTNYQVLHPVYSLKKIFIEKTIEGLTLFPTRKNIHKGEMKLPANIELALLRATCGFAMKHPTQEIEMSRLGATLLENKPDNKDVLI
jgi:hypothetical protein